MPNTHAHKATGSSTIAALMGWPLFRTLFFSLSIIAIVAFATPRIQLDFPQLTALQPTHAQNPDPADQICPRFAPGSVVTPPPDLWSQNGTLEVSFSYRTAVDQQGLTRYCYI